MAGNSVSDNALCDNVSYGNYHIVSVFYFNRACFATKKAEETCFEARFYHLESAREHGLTGRYDPSLYVD